MNTVYGEDALTHAQASVFLGCSGNTLTTRYKEWGLIPTKMGGKNYWFRQDLQKFMDKRAKEGSSSHMPFKVAIGRGYVAS